MIECRHFIEAIQNGSAVRSDGSDGSGGILVDSSGDYFVHESSYIDQPCQIGKGIMVCPESGLRYKLSEPGVVRCLDLDEEAPLPEAERIGKISYRQLKDRLAKGP